jgi:hypothetical protein
VSARSTHIRIRARVMIDGELVAPLDGSYLAALNDPKTLR